ncbi:MAG TPA: Gfo/Idh/MocA family oxidoreductase [Polyangiaceae bacterium]|nr:Gfo/Idh/MocA family oxidoreductase [Polyangiaceae bacterium]
MGDEKKIRYAVIGLGNIAQVAVLPAFEHAAENSELAAIVSSNDRKRAELARRFHVEHAVAYEQFDRLVSEERIDAVYIALPNHLHAEWTVRAASAGLHVLCEKPMALDENECHTMIDAAREHDRLLMIAYRLHFEEANLKAMELIRTGEIGEPRFFSSVFSHQVRPGDIRTEGEKGGGALFDMGVYCVNAARYLLSDEPSEAFAFMIGDHDERSRDVDETTAAVLRFPDGKIAQFTASQGTTSISSYRVSGTEGDILVEPAYEYTEPLRITLTRGDKKKEFEVEKRDQFAPELIYFSRCILERRTPEPSGEEGLADIRVIRALMRSASEGKAVRFEPSPKRKRPSPEQEMRERPVPKQETVDAPSPSTS